MSSKTETIIILAQTLVICALVFHLVFFNATYKKTVESANYKAFSELIEKQQGTTNVNNQTVEIKK